MTHNTIKRAQYYSILNSLCLIGINTSLSILFWNTCNLRAGVGCTECKSYFNVLAYSVVSIFRVNKSHCIMFHIPTLTPTARPLCQSTSYPASLTLRMMTVMYTSVAEPWQLLTTWTAQTWHVTWLNSRSETYTSHRCCRNLTRIYNICFFLRWDLINTAVKIHILVF